MAKYNRWWQTNKIGKEDYSSKHQRPLLEELKKHLERRQILLVYGLRRVGKTTLFYQLIQHLLDRGVPSKNILYFSFDEESAEIAKVLRTYEEKVLKRDLLKEKRVFIFFDEVQKLKGWESKIKIFYDLYPNAKFFLSGSASISLRRGSFESLAGRVFDFHLKPLGFAEFLEWRGVEAPKENIELAALRLKPLFLDHLRKGGFPEIVKEDNDEDIRKYIKNAVLERIIYRDLPLELGLKDVDLLRTLVEMVARDPGMIINFDRLSRDLGRSRTTVTNYLNYLKYALITQELKNLRPGFLIASRKARKVYPTNTAFCFAYRDDFYQDNILQKVAETAVVNALEGEFYFRNSFEVDLILRRQDRIFPFEVKYGQVERKSILKFLKEFEIEKGVIVTKNTRGSEDNLDLISLWQFLLEVQKWKN